VVTAENDLKDGSNAAESYFEFEGEGKVANLC